MSDMSAKLLAPQPGAMEMQQAAFSVPAPEPEGGGGGGSAPYANAARMPTVMGESGGRTTMARGTFTAPLSSLQKEAVHEPWTAEGQLNAAYFHDTEEDVDLALTKKIKEKVKDALPGWQPDGPEYKHIAWQHSNTAGDVQGIIERLAAHDAEAEELGARMATPIRLENCLQPNEEVLAQIRCLGFDGFPDWGTWEHEQRLGDCVLAIVGASDPSAGVPCRLVLSHVGKLRAISALELDIMCCGRKTESGMWDIRRDQSTGLAVLGASTQLVAISAEQIQTLHLSKGSGKQNKSL